MTRFALACLFLVCTAQASEIQGFGDFLSENISGLSQALNTCSVQQNGLGDANSDEAWFFRRIWLRVRPQVTFSIPGALANLQITPEVEILFDRPIPTGWGTYKP